MTMIAIQTRHAIRALFYRLAAWYARSKKRLNCRGDLNVAAILRSASRARYSLLTALQLDHVAPPSASRRAAARATGLIYGPVLARLHDDWKAIGRSSPYLGEGQIDAACVVEFAKYELGAKATAMLHEDTGVTIRVHPDELAEFVEGFVEATPQLIYTILPASRRDDIIALHSVIHSELVLQTKSRSVSKLTAQILADRRVPLTLFEFPLPAANVAARIPRRDRCSSQLRGTAETRAQSA